MTPELSRALTEIERRLTASSLTLSADPVDYGARLTLSDERGRSLSGTLYHSPRKGRFTLTLAPSEERVLVQALADAARDVCDARVSGDQAALQDAQAPVSGIPALDRHLVEALPRLQAAGLFPESMDPIPHGLKLVFTGERGAATVSLYHSAKKGLSVVAGAGKAGALANRAAALLRPVSELPDAEQSLGRWVGTDEAGKGDYFGPLVTSGVLLDGDSAEEVVGLGAADSKRLGRKQLAELAGILRRVLGDCAATVAVGPRRYNELYEDMRRRGQKLNALLAWTHGRVVRDLIDRGHTFDAVVVDRFASQALIQRSMPAGTNLIARPRAEDNPAVAAASILARDTYMRQLRKLSNELGVELSPGAGPPVLRLGRQLVQRHGADVLRRAGKLHFRTTQTILGE